MPGTTDAQPRRVLEPEARISEVLFGLIMVLTFTGSLSVAEAGRDDVRAMLVGALGCNFAWGLIDGIMYLMTCLSERGKRIRLLGAVQGAASPAAAHEAIASTLPPAIAAALPPQQLEHLRLQLKALPAPPARTPLHREDVRGALAVFLLVFIATLPVVLPFVFMHDTMRAMRASNAIAIVMLYLTGHAFGRLAGHRPWVMGMAMVVLGSVLVGITIALGG